MVSPVSTTSVSSSSVPGSRDVVREEARVDNSRPKQCTLRGCSCELNVLPVTQGVERPGKVLPSGIYEQSADARKGPSRGQLAIEVFRRSQSEPER